MYHRFKKTWTHLEKLPRMASAQLHQIQYPAGAICNFACVMGAGRLDDAHAYHEHEWVTQQVSLSPACQPKVLH